MKIKISREELQKRSLFIASPVYGGQPFGLYTDALDRLKLTMFREGLIFDSRQTFNESLVPRARNYLVNEFLKTNMTHLLFWDADIIAETDDVIRLLACADPMSDKDVVCAAYPKKHICWNKIRDAAKAGYGDDDPNMLAEFVGEFFFTARYPDEPHDLDTPLDVIETGTGFMMIQRHVIQKIIAAHPEFQYKDDWTKESMSSVFNVGVKSQRYLSEDFDFCELVCSLGMKIWVLPNINLTHIGFHGFKGNIKALASLANSINQGE